MTIRHAIIRNNIVESIIIWDGVTSFTAPAGTQLIAVPNNLVGPGWNYDNGNWIPSTLTTSLAVPLFQIFTSSGIWVKPSQGKIVRPRVIGGGGGGTNGGPASGGGGGYSTMDFPFSQMPSSIIITVGGGAGVQSTGGTSSFGSFLIAGGGGGGFNLSQGAGGAGSTVNGANGVSAGAGGGFGSSGASDTRFPWLGGVNSLYGGGGSAGVGGQQGVVTVEVLT